MPLLSLLPDIFVPTFELTLNRAPLPTPIAKQIFDIGVTLHLSPPDSFTFRLNDPTLKLVAATGGLFTEGSRVELSLGFVGNTKRLLVGEISALAADFPADGPISIQVQGFDLLHRLTRGTVYRTFEGPTPGSGLPDSQIVTQIAAEMLLVPSVDTTAARTEPRTQNHVTNLAFLGELTNANGFFFWVDGETLFFKKERPAPTTIKLERGKTLLSFSPRLSTAGQVKTVTVRGWDPIQKQSFSVQVQRSSGGTALAATGQQQLAQGTGGKSELVVTDAPVASAQEAQAYGEALLAMQQQTVITGRGSCVGNPELIVGSLLEVTGVGRFQGTYLVEQATHTLNASGYQTSFEVRSQS